MSRLHSHSDAPHTVTISESKQSCTYCSDCLVQSVLVTLCCFLPTGIVAIVRASDARSSRYFGDHYAASYHRRSARRMVIISLIIGLLSMVFMGVAMGLLFGLGRKILKF